MPDQFCAAPQCLEQARWVVRYSGEFEDFDFSCKGHVQDFLEDNTIHAIYPVGFQIEVPDGD